MYMRHWASIIWLGAVSKVNQHFNISGLLYEAAWVVPYKLNPLVKQIKFMPVDKADF